MLYDHKSVGLLTIMIIIKMPSLFANMNDLKQNLELVKWQPHTLSLLVIVKIIQDSVELCSDPDKVSYCSLFFGLFT